MPWLRGPPPSGEEAVNAVYQPRLFVPWLPVDAVNAILAERHYLGPINRGFAYSGTNTLRGISPPAVCAARQKCPKGHEYEQRREKPTQRRCYTCRRERERIRAKSRWARLKSDPAALESEHKKRAERRLALAGREGETP